MNSLLTNQAFLIRKIATNNFFKLLESRVLHKGACVGSGSMQDYKNTKFHVKYT